MTACAIPLLDVERVGFAVIRSAVSTSELKSFDAESARLAAIWPDRVQGLRNLLQRSPVFAEWARCERLLSLLPPRMQPVRAILFDKTPATNWKVAWHQDLTISVAQKREAPGYAPWSLKDGTAHVQPPMPVLEGMLTVRLHLDDTPRQNGALKVIPGSHREGRLNAPDIAALRKKTKEHICEAAAGDILLMKPLLVHASSASGSPGHRRVVHIEYAHAGVLHPFLRWAES